MALSFIRGQAVSNDETQPSPSPSPGLSFIRSTTPAPTAQAPTSSPSGGLSFISSGGGIGGTQIPADLAAQAVGAALMNRHAPETPAGVPSDADQGMSVGGFLENAVAGIGGMVEGIGNVIGGGIQDTAGAVQRLDFVPGLGGEQSLEKRLREEGSAAWRVAVGPGDAPSLYNAFLDDTKYRYGPLFKGDLEEFSHRMYEQPMSFGLDALTVGAAVGAPFKVAEAVSLAGKVAGGAPYAASRAAQIAGRTGATRAILGTGSKELASFTSVAGKTVRMPSNPVTRVAKDFLIRRISKPIDEAYEAARAAAPGENVLGLATEAYNVAKSVGAERVLTPVWSQLAERRLAGLMAGMKRSRLGDHRSEALKEFHDPYMMGNKAAVGAQIVEHVQGSAPNQSYWEGGRIEPGLPGYGNLDLHMNNLPELGPDQVPDVVPHTPEIGVLHGRALTSVFRSGRVHPARFNSPHAPDGTGARYEVIINDMTQAEGAINTAAGALRGPVAGVRNYLPEGDEGWQGVSAFIDTPEGMVEVAVGTEKLFRAQRTASKIFEDRNWHATEAQRYTEEAAELTRKGAKPAKIAAAVQRIEFHKREVEAANYLGGAMFEGPFRQTYAVLNGLDYDPSLSVADELRVWSHEWITSPNISRGSGLNYQTIVNRAYGPQRLTSFMYDLAQIEDGLTHLLPKFKTWNKAQPALIDALAGFPRGLIEDVLDRKFLNELSLKTPGPSATAITQKLRAALRENVINGDIPGYSWQEMHFARQAENLGMPHYYPHTPVSDLPMSSLARASKAQRNVWHPSTPPNVNQHWMGHLMEEGTFVMDPVEAYTRVFNSITKHHEVIRYINDVVDKFGYTLSKAEIETMRAVKNNPVVFVNGKGVKAEISLRAQLEAATYDYIRAGYTVEKATVKAIEESLSDLQKAAIVSSTGTVKAIPRHIAKQVEHEIRGTLGLGWKSRVFWDSPMAVWRASVLSFSPRWILNNTIGNIIFTGLKDPKALHYAIRQLSKRQRTVMEFMIGEGRLRDIERGFSHNLPATAARFSDEALAGAPRWTKAANALNEAAPSRALRTASSWSRRINSHIEEAFRRGVYLSDIEKASVQRWSRMFGSSKMMMDKIAREGITPANHERALLSVDAVLGNYTNLSPIEQDIVRRFIAPFYGFYRHVAKYTAKMPFDNPIATKVLLEIGKMDDEMDQYLPEWMRSGVDVGSFGDGQEMFLGLRAANPLTSIPGFADAPLAVVNPAIKVILERTLGINLFTGKEYTSESIYEARDGSKWQLHENGRPTPVDGKTLPPWWRHIAQQFGPYAPLEKTMAATAGPGLGAQYSATGNVIVDDNGVPVYPIEPWTIFSNFLGLPFYSFDVEGERQDFLEAQEEAARYGG